MGISKNFTPGRIAGWMMLSFVMAVGAHSMLPYRHTGDVILAAVFLGSTLPLVFVRSRLVVAALLIIASLTFGWWRFERASVPKLRRIGSHQLIAKETDEHSVFAKVRTAFSERIQSVLPSEDANLVSGILYGDQDLTALQKKRFRSAGLSLIFLLLL
jgi:hypothetical protein